MDAESSDRILLPFGSRDCEPHDINEIDGINLPYRQNSGRSAETVKIYSSEIACSSFKLKNRKIPRSQFSISFNAPTVKDYD